MKKKLFATVAASLLVATPVIANDSPLNANDFNEKDSNVEDATKMAPVLVVGVDGKPVFVGKGTTSVTTTTTTKNMVMTGVTSKINQADFFGLSTKDLIDTIDINGCQNEMKVVVSGDIAVVKEETDHEAGFLIAGREKLKEGFFDTVFAQSVYEASEDTYTSGNLERHNTVDVITGDSNSMLLLTPVGKIFDIGRNATGMYSDIVSSNAAQDSADAAIKMANKWEPTKINNNVSSSSTSSANPTIKVNNSNKNDINNNNWNENNNNNWNENNNNNWNQQWQTQCQKNGGSREQCQDQSSVLDLDKLNINIAKIMPGVRVEMPTKSAPKSLTLRSTYG